MQQPIVSSVNNGAIRNAITEPTILASLPSKLSTDEVRLNQDVASLNQDAQTIVVDTQKSSSAPAIVAEENAASILKQGSKVYKRKIYDAATRKPV